MTATPTRLYKAVRPDGTSFYDQATRWAVGRVTEHPHPTKVEDKDAHGYLSVFDVPTECTGCDWPCRLLVVEPVGDVWQPDPEGLPHKWAGHAFRVVEELPSHEAFGPQGEHVVALIERAGTLTAQETDSLVTTWSTTRSAAWVAAWVAVRAAAWDAVWVAAWDAARDATRDAAWVATWDAVRDAAGVAAVALVVRDLIPTADYDTLTLPWRRIIGRIHPDDPEVESC